MPSIYPVAPGDGNNSALSHTFTDILTLNLADRDHNIYCGSL